MNQYWILGICISLNLARMGTASDSCTRNSCIGLANYCCRTGECVTHVSECSYTGYGYFSNNGPSFDLNPGGMVGFAFGVFVVALLLATLLYCCQKVRAQRASGRPPAITTRTYHNAISGRVASVNTVALQLDQSNTSFDDLPPDYAVIKVDKEFEIYKNQLPTYSEAKMYPKGDFQTTSNSKEEVKIDPRDVSVDTTYLTCEKH